MKVGSDAKLRIFSTTFRETVIFHIFVNLAPCALSKNLSVRTDADPLPDSLRFLLFWPCTLLYLYPPVPSCFLLHRKCCAAFLHSLCNLLLINVLFLQSFPKAKCLVTGRLAYFVMEKHIRQIDRSAWQTFIRIIFFIYHLIFLNFIIRF